MILLRNMLTEVGASSTTFSIAATYDDVVEAYISYLSERLSKISNQDVTPYTAALRSELKALGRSNIGEIQKQEKYLLDKTKQAAALKQLATIWNRILVDAVKQTATSQIGYPKRVAIRSLISKQDLQAEIESYGTTVIRGWYTDVSGRYQNYADLNIRRAMNNQYIDAVNQTTTNVVNHIY